MSRWSKLWGFLKHLSRKRWFVVSLVILTMAVVLAGYYSALRRALVFECEDPGRGIAFEIRGNWDIDYFERSGTYHFDRRRLIKRPFRTIDMLISFSMTKSFEPDRTPIDLEEIMGWDLERWRDSHESYALIHPTSIVERGDYRIATATVQVGRLKDPESGWPWMQGKEQQLVDIYLISSIRDDEPDHTIPYGDWRLDHNQRLAAVYVLRRNNARINAEVEEIVNSFRFIEYNDDPFGGEPNLVCR